MQELSVQKKGNNGADGDVLGLCYSPGLLPVLSQHFCQLFLLVHTSLSVLNPSIFFSVVRIMHLKGWYAFQMHIFLPPAISPEL